MQITRKKGEGRIRIVEHNRGLLWMICILIIVLIGVVILAMFLGNREDKNIGGDTDERGCLTVAGYSWNETKQKCVREFEEAEKGYCNDEERNANVCASAWEPVCGNAFETKPELNPKTYQNSCFACMDKTAEYWIKGECEEE